MDTSFVDNNDNNFINNNTDSQINSITTDFDYYLPFSQIPIRDIACYVSFKLDIPSNYLVWKNQISHGFIDTNLYGFVDGSFPPEPPLILQDDGSDQPNPYYLEWIQTDYFVSSCIHATVVRPLAAKLLDKKTARKKWLYLAKIFSQQVFARKCKLRAKLHSMRRNSYSSVYEYLHWITFVSDYLAGIDERQPKDSDLVMYTLSGLGRGYQGFVVAVQDSETPITFDELCSRLISYEQMMVDQEERESVPETAIICQICNGLGHSAIICQYTYMRLCAPSENKLFQQMAMQFEHTEL